MRPSPDRTAAPTRKREYGAYAWSRAAKAIARSSRQSASDVAEGVPTTVAPETRCFTRRATPRGTTRRDRENRPPTTPRPSRRRRRRWIVHRAIADGRAGPQREGARARARDRWMTWSGHSRDRPSKKASRPREVRLQCRGARNRTSAVLHRTPTHRFGAPKAGRNLLGWRRAAHHRARRARDEFPRA